MKYITYDKGKVEITKVGEMSIGRVYLEPEIE
jgi:hypothetical protein